MAIWNQLQWTCVTLLITSCSDGYKYESLLNPRQSDVSSNEHRSKDEAAASVRDGIVFPDAAQPAQSAQPAQPAQPAYPVRGKFVPQVTEECKRGETLCLNVPNYPEEYINSLLSNSAEEWHATVDQLIQDPVKINQRIGEDPDTFELCSYKETIAYPKAAQNKDNHWYTIINTPSHVQGFRVEICRQENSGCHPSATFRLGMVASCKQKYVLREMRALDSSGRVISDYFRLPSCCSCVIKYDDSN